MTDDEMIAPEGGIEKEVKNAPQEAQPSPAPPPVQKPPTEVPSGGQEPTKNDIERILKEVKLPERRDFKASADISKVVAQEPEASILEEHIVKPAASRKEETAVPTVPEQETGGPQKADFSSAVVPLRTLKDDLQTVVREKKISLVRAATLEEEKRHGQEHLAPEQQEIRAQKSHRTTLILFASLILVLLSAAALFGVYYVAQQQAALPPAPATSILFAEQAVTFPLDNQSSQDLKNALAQASTRQLGQLGSITRVVPTITSTSTGGAAQTTPATLSRFFSALGIDAPQELMGAIGPDFFFGFHVVDVNAPVFVIPVTSYDHAFAGMLAWEPTMDSDLAPIFPAVPATKPGANGLQEARTFEDDVLRNYDVRELKDDSGNIVLYYSFPTPQILVIAESPYSFPEILSRLQAEREL